MVGKAKPPPPAGRYGRIIERPDDMRRRRARLLQVRRGRPALRSPAAVGRSVPAAGRCRREGGVVRGAIGGIGIAESMKAVRQGRGAIWLAPSLSLSGCAEQPASPWTGRC